MTNKSHPPFLALLLGIAGLSCSDLATTQPASVATNLAFLVQPSNAVRDTAFSLPLTVRIVSTAGQLVTSAGNQITLALAVNPGHASLHGTTTVAARNGVATFPGILLDSLGAGFRLVATSPGLVGDTSAAFAVTLSLHDADGDGYSPNAGDCNDADSTVHPGAVDFPMRPTSIPTATGSTGTCPKRFSSRSPVSIRWGAEPRPLPAAASASGSPRR